MRKNPCAQFVYGEWGIRHPIDFRGWNAIIIGVDRLINRYGNKQQQGEDGNECRFMMAHK